MDIEEISRRDFIRLTGSLALVTTVGGCIGNGFGGSDDQITITDLTGREISVEAPAERIVVTYNFGDVVAVGGEDVFENVVGFAQYWKRFSPSFWQKYKNEFPQLNDIPNVGYRDDVDVEHVISLDPDVVITSKSHYESYSNIYQRISNAGIPVLALNYHEESMEDRKKSTELLGAVLGKEERAQQIWNYCKKKYDEVFDRLEKIDRAKPRVYIEPRFMEYSDDYVATYGDQSWGAIIDQCRGKNIAAGKGTRPVLSEEFLLKEGDPEVFIVEGVNWPEALGYNPEWEEDDLIENIEETYFERSGWKELSAWKEERYHVTHHEFFRHVYDFIGYQFIAKANYPSEFEDIDPEKTWEEFHEKFLPIDYSGQWMVYSSSE